MDLIAQVIGTVLAFFAGVVGNILAHDLCISANSVCAKIIKAAAARLALFDRESTEQEWLADLWERETVTEKYRHAVGCLMAAPEMRRCALKAPFAGEAPGIAWKRRKDRWEARWQSSPKALEQGYKVKSVKLYSVRNKEEITSDEKTFVVDVCNELQAHHDQWINHPNSRRDGPTGL